ncbi:hypothetical protein [Selenomonas sp. F0473]|uniref:hypothetical protein n=1 Tax=Selenomonas sp. F0473 TaxID=999423 RepID=UPI00029E5F3E|nr:hypothetical protein [Selenomonas sp. F0473]EKU70816.1 hypothetical protein HMPREF9161_01365 [Selenomonas sp. F0473]
MIVYSKYNRGRKPEYQIVTFIEEDGQGKYIYKTALTPTARKHITAMFHNYEILSLLYGKAHVAKVERIDEDSLRFEYIEGVPWGRRIMERTANKGRKAFFSEMEKYYSFLQKEDIGRKACAFVDFSGSAQESRNVDIDLHPNNILIVGDRFIIIDYEWLYPDAPITFVFQRCILNFYYNYYYTCLKDIISIDDIWHEFCVNQNDINCYKELEKSFSETVGMELFVNKYQKKIRTFEEMMSIKKQIKMRGQRWLRKLSLS